MPQMAPLSWITLMIYFCTIFMLFNLINFFSFNYLPSKNSCHKTSIKSNWKW